jgi:hypothetical protein
MLAVRWWVASSVVALAVSCGGSVEVAGERAGEGGQGGGSDAGVTESGPAGTGGATPDAGKCSGTAPQPGCFYNGIGCPAGQACSAVGCAPSQCGCDPAQGWWCTSDCNGGTCIAVTDGSAPKPCGGLAGQTCGPDEWCDYTYPEMNWCGGDDGSGVCQPRPQDCPADCPGTCGCDGNFYCNSCMAHAAGYDDGAPCPNVDAGVDCDTAISGVALLVNQHACTAVVRVSFQTFALLGYQLICGGFASIDEGKARIVAQADAGFGQNGDALAGANPSDVFVFRQPPGDFGGVGVVSAHTGLSVFGGSIIWAGSGEITWPKTPWGGPNGMGGPDCALSMWPKWRGFDLAGENVYTDALAQQALQTAWNTAVPAGLAKKQSITEAVVLLYPRSVGVFNPFTAEWIVLINSQQ